MQQPSLDFTKFENNIKQLFPHAYNEYQSQFHAPFEYVKLHTFFRQKKIIVSYNYTNVLNSNFEGTYNFKVTIDDKQDLEKLDRVIKSFTYYGISSYEKAFFKAIKKAFEIIECLVTGKTIPRKIGRRYQ